MYISYLDYIQLGEKKLPEFDFRKYEYEAERVVDDVTTGVDGVKKLQVAFPEDETDKRAVVMTMTALISKLAEITDLKKSITETGAGGVGGVVASVSSGSESISYATSFVSDEVRAATSEEAKQQTLKRIARDGLRGIKDANGVNLLYGGSYV